MRYSMNKIVKLFRMNKYERRLSLCRNTYSWLNKRKFKSIGKKSYFWNPIFLSGTQYIEIGERTGIWPHARVEVIDEWEGQVDSPILKFGNNVYVGQNLHIACADSIIIEDDVLISAGVFITDLSHNTADNDRAVIEQGITTKPVKICEGAFIGKDSIILPGVTLGRHCVIGANAVVTKDVAEFATVCGVPAAEIASKGMR